MEDRETQGVLSQDSDEPVSSQWLLSLSNGGILTGSKEGVRDVVTCLWAVGSVQVCASLAMLRSCGWKGLAPWAHAGCVFFARANVRLTLSPPTRGAVLAGPQVS